VFEVRPSNTSEEFARAIYGIGQYFGGPLNEERIERFRRLMPLDRMFGAFDDAEVIGGAGSFPFQFSVPGGILPCAGVTVVGVSPTHRRRGVLRAMMAAQLRDVHEREEPIAALWASEEMIYGRFGYGIASWCGEIRLPRVWSGYTRPVERRGQTRFVTAEEAATLFPPVWDSLLRQRPGVFQRSPEWWAVRRLRMPDEEQANPKRFVVLEVDGSVEAYAIYRFFASFEEGSPNSRLEVSEVIGATPEATAEMWRFVLDLDLYGMLECSLLPLDHALLTLLASPRRARFRIGDSLWIRLVDVGAALSGRTYATGAGIVFEVRDAACPWNEARWKLAAGTATRTKEAADIALDVGELGAAYLGAVSFTQLRDGLLLEELTSGAVQRADAIFDWRPLPWCPEIF
jgi:predicted acetyltransferase